MPFTLVVAEEHCGERAKRVGTDNVWSKRAPDCDGDAILLRVEQTGAARHEGFHRCFFRVVDRDGSVRVTDQRLVDPDQAYGKKP